MVAGYQLPVRRYTNPFSIVSCFFQQNQLQFLCSFAALRATFPLLLSASACRQQGLHETLGCAKAPLPRCVKSSALA